ncbi:alkene reductase [Methylocaldum sp. RMAD-M]|uniref:alkene reductase n=1 Tax=Methylocaldum sp. RMAD-M TaxID=2806557 RepID=UPI000A32945B|nr:alkene reductase [Methylocaldum sp. RMAD-M]MBP1151577.1 N-ethylmaleimide reductase [Methylocaldum sp. RMAD-M]
MNNPIFEPYALGPYTLKNRMVMAPLTRSRAGQPGNVPTDLNALYYAQRASAGLIISEATQVSQQGQGYAWTPGIHRPDQVVGWRSVAEAVHRAGGLIFMQLWHVGRISHPALQPDGQLPVAPSANRPSGTAFIVNERGEGEMVPFVTPRAMAIEEMPYIVKQYAHGASNALHAGLDGVEIHAANGYLLDQFLNTSSNHRTDEYGGPVENRARLLMEVVAAVCRVWGPQRVGVRLSPLGSFNDMGDDDPEALFRHVAEQLNRFNLAYLHIVEPEMARDPASPSFDPRGPAMMKLIRAKYSGTLIVCGGYDYRKAVACLEEGRADLVAFGRLFIANPDLPERFRQNAELNPPDESTYYGGGAKGYVDYPTLKQLRGEEPMTAIGTAEKS